jgi:Holliday junction resolvasome RuvABC endonuclease subunit
MRIAGIDPDTKAITIVVLDDGAACCHRVQASGRRAEDRVQALAAGLEEASINWQGVQWVYVETPVLAQFKGKTNAKALRDQAQVVGIIRSYLWRRQIDHSLIDNTIWKKGLLGNSNASKEEIAAYAQKVLGVPTDQPQDAYDAACIAAWGCNNVPKGE